jgi:hypothetical protein
MAASRILIARLDSAYQLFSLSLIVFSYHRGDDSTRRERKDAYELSKTNRLKFNVRARVTGDEHPNDGCQPGRKKIRR